MTSTHTLSLAEIEEFLNASKTIKFSAINKKETYKWIENETIRLQYRKLKRSKRGLVRKYFIKITGYSKSQIDRLVQQQIKTGHVKKSTYSREKLPTKYTRQDIALMAETDKLFRVLSGPAMRLIYKREYEEFGNFEFKKLSEISVSHIYNLRSNFIYRNIIKTYHHTKPVMVPIGLRRKPMPNGKPGYIRVDTVHQGDDSELGKSVYHINFVDEVVQWEVVVCVPVISEKYLAPALEAMLELFSFVIIEFHSDNGSEFINYTVADILNRLHIQQTKSRPRRSNDNGLVETKNNAIIRKEMGYGFIQKGAYKLINNFYQNFYNPYLNYHRPCGFVTVITDKRGKEKKIYKPNDYMMPYEKLKSLPNAEHYLKPGITFAQLDKIAYNQSDVEFARNMRKARSTLSVKIKESYLRDSILQDY